MLHTSQFDCGECDMLLFVSQYRTIIIIKTFINESAY